MENKIEERGRKYNDKQERWEERGSFEA